MDLPPRCVARRGGGEAARTKGELGPAAKCISCVGQGSPRAWHGPGGAVRAYQFLMEGQVQSASYITVLLCYPIAMWAQGGETLDSSRPYDEEVLEQVLARGLFPRGRRSLLFVLALAASEVGQDATALFVIGARARLAHVLEANDIYDLRAKEMAGPWQFSRYFRSVCGPGFWVMAVAIGGGWAMMALGEYMIICWLFRNDGAVGF